VQELLTAPISGGLPNGFFLCPLLTSRRSLHYFLFHWFPSPRRRISVQLRSDLPFETGTFSHVPFFNFLLYASCVRDPRFSPEKPKGFPSRNHESPQRLFLGAPFFNDVYPFPFPGRPLETAFPLESDFRRFRQLSLSLLYIDSLNPGLSLVCIFPFALVSNESS